MIEKGVFEELVGAFASGSSAINSQAEEVAKKEGIFGRIEWATQCDAMVCRKREAIYTKQLLALERFGIEAKRLSLSYVVIKGLPLSQTIYDDYRVRESRDIDILVLEKDLPKAHAVALRSGFLQAGEGFRARQLAAMGELSGAMLKGIASDYPILIDSGAPHLSPYLKIEDDGSLTVLELHRFCKGLPTAFVEPFVAMAVPCVIEGVRLPIPCPALDFVTLLLAAHDACEGIRANLCKGTLGFRYLVDLFCWIEKGAPVRDASTFVFDTGVHREVGEAIRDLVLCFPSAYDSTERFFPLYRSAWGVSYVDRLLDDELRCNSSSAVVKHAFETKACAQGSRINEMLFGMHDCIESPAQIEVVKGEQSVCLMWLIDEKSLEFELPHLLFNVSLVWVQTGTGTPTFGVSIRVFCENGYWKAKEKKSTLPDLDGHVSRRSGTDISPSIEISRRGRFLRLCLTYGLPEKIPGNHVCAFASFHKHEFGGVYHLIQGTIPLVELSKMMKDGAVS